MNKRKSILIVDDNLSYLHSLKTILKKEYETILASSLKEAKKYARPEIDLFVVDIQLDPDDLNNMDGIDFLKWIKSNKVLKNIPFITISVHRNCVETCEVEGADYFMPKPLNIPELKKVIKDLLD